MSPEDRDHRRRWLVRSTVAVVVVVALVTGVPWLYARIVAQQRPEPLALSTVEATSGPSVPATVDVADLDGTWTVTDGSEAGYRLGEVLSGQAVDAVGRTQDVTGWVEVADGALVAAEVVVEVASVTSEESARDAYMRLALEVETHPLATFVLTEPADVSALATTTDAVALPVSGTLEIHGVAVPATATIEARRTAEGVEVVGSAPVVLADHGLTAPDLAFVRVEQSGLVEMRLLLTQDA